MKPRLENYVFPRLHCETASERKKKKKKTHQPTKKLNQFSKLLNSEEAELSCICG